MDRAILIGTDLADARLLATSLRGALLRSCDLESADLTRVDLSNADVTGNDMESVDLQDARLMRAQLRGVDLESADLSNVDARNADFSGANLGRARLSGGRFDGAQLVGTNLSSARLERTSLRGADLRRAHLGLRLVEAEQEDDQRLQGDPGHPCFPLLDCALPKRTKVSDDVGVGALLVDTDLSGADLSNAFFNGVVMLRGSLDRARLPGAVVAGSIVLDVPMKEILCPSGQRSSNGCPDLLSPPAGPQLQRAEARVRWLQSLPFPWA
jgi:uncharacterized protein YjbI with pentapeptide repeats